MSPRLIDHVTGNKTASKNLWPVIRPPNLVFHHFERILHIFEEMFNLGGPVLIEAVLTNVLRFFKSDGAPNLNYVVSNRRARDGFNALLDYLAAEFTPFVRVRWRNSCGSGEPGVDAGTSQRLRGVWCCGSSPSTTLVSSRSSHVDWALGESETLRIEVDLCTLVGSQEVDDSGRITVQSLGEKVARGSLDGLVVPLGVGAQGGLGARWQVPDEYLLHKGTSDTNRRYLAHSGFS